MYLLLFKSSTKREYGSQTKFFLVITFFRRRQMNRVPSEFAVDFTNRSVDAVEFSLLLIGVVKPRRDAFVRDQTEQINFDLFIR